MVVDASLRDWLSLLAFALDLVANRDSKQQPKILL
jgi:hypothetical protein